MTDLQFETLYELAKNYKIDECQCYANCISKDKKSFMNELWKRVPKNHTKAIMINCAVDGDIYVDKRFKAINESSFGKLVRHFQKGYICASAYHFPPAEKGEKDEDYKKRCEPYMFENKRNHNDLKEFMKTAGKDGERLGYIELAGIYKGVAEISILIPYVDTYTDEEWKDLALTLCIRYSQESVLYKTPNDSCAYYVYGNGSIKKLSSELLIIRNVNDLDKLPAYLSGLKKERGSLAKGKDYRFGSISVLMDESISDLCQRFKYDYTGISYIDESYRNFVVSRRNLLGIE